MTTYLTNKDIGGLEVGNSIKGEYVGETKELKGLTVTGKYAGITRDNKGKQYLFLVGYLIGTTGVKVHKCGLDEFKFSRTRFVEYHSIVLSEYLEGFKKSEQYRDIQDKVNKVGNYQKYIGGYVTDNYCEGAFGRVYDLRSAYITKIGYNRDSNDKDEYWVEVIKNYGKSNQEKYSSVILSKNNLEYLLSKFCVEAFW